MEPPNTYLRGEIIEKGPSPTILNIFEMMMCVCFRNGYRREIILFHEYHNLTCQSPI